MIAMNGKLLLFDLDGTLLRSDKTISPRTMAALRRCRTNGSLIGVCTSRSEQNTLAYLADLQPDVLITSGGALVRKGQEAVFLAVFTPRETLDLIRAMREVCGPDVEITADTADGHYWNYRVDPKALDRNWGDSIWCGFERFDRECFKLCVQIFDEA